ncbi:hypothetical protein MMC14_004841 [Varicellaria rhodocarpa]|nr:hypothetical protein [Varicellaria rhodocarpa]
MDPLSIGASVLAVLGAAATAGRALEKLCRLRHAPDDLIALINEVSDMQVSCGNLNQIVNRASQKITELNNLIYHDLVKNGTAQSYDITPKVSRKAFLRHTGKIKSLKIDLREVKLNLLFAVAMLTCDEKKLTYSIASADVSRLKI